MNGFIQRGQAGPGYSNDPPTYPSFTNQSMNALRQVKTFTQLCTQNERTIRDAQTKLFYLTNYHQVKKYPTKKYLLLSRSND